ncbi:hypothetical protein ACO2I3_19370 [Leptospira interrogans]
MEDDINYRYLQRSCFLYSAARSHLGRVGLAEEDAARSGRRSRPFARPPNTCVIGRLDTKNLGFMKVIADSETKHILGGCHSWVSGDEAIHGMSDTMNAPGELSGPSHRYRFHLVLRCTPMTIPIVEGQKEYTNSSHNKKFH